MAPNRTDCENEPGSELQPVHGDPPAWAKVRPPLSDSLKWFRIVQGSLYHCEKIAYGFLVDGDCGERVHIDDEVIITRIGGNGGKDQNDKFFLKKDQTLEDTTVKSLTQSREKKIPVGVIMGDRAEGLKRKLPHRFNVMGWFRITDIWPEKVTGKVGFKVRLEKLNLAEKSWWSVKGTPNPPPLNQRDFVTKPPTRQCLVCSETSFRLYNEGWMCLNHECDHFWSIKGTAPTGLTFYATFLNYRNLPDPEIAPQSELVPHFSATVSEIQSTGGTLRQAWRGIVCPNCSQCVSRVFWEGWKCTECGFQVMMNITSLTPDEAAESSDGRRKTTSNRGFMSPQIDDQSVAPYKKQTYILPGVGLVTHFVANKAINSSPNGPNDMFRNLQNTQLGLKRYPMTQAVVKGTMTSHFVVNYGMPYKFVVSVDSKGFDEAPDDVLRALSRLSWATKQAVNSAGDAYQPPNELLILGYFEDMKVGFHDDGEDSLGPTIATLSLGAKSKMEIRMKTKYYHGYRYNRSRLGSYHPVRDDPVLQGCKHEDERRDLKEQYDANMISKAEYDEARMQLFTDKKYQNSTPPVLIRMELKHGDLVVMHGADLQRYYEHSVRSEGRMRFALTARHILADHVADHELEKGDFSLTPEQEYDGN